MRKMLGLWLGLILSLWLGVSLVLAQSGYPQPTDVYVNDFAHLLNSADTALITQLLTELKTKNGIEVTVVTLNSIHDYPTGDKTIETFATHLFNTWGIGDKANSKGGLILVAVQDRQMRIELGTGYESQYNDEMQQVINEHMLPAFKQNDYGRGLYQGTRAVIATLTGAWPPDERPVPSSDGNNSSVPVTPASSRSRSDSRMGLLLFGAFVVMVGYLILAHIFGWPVGNNGSDNDDHRHSWSSQRSSRSSSSSNKSSFGGGRSSGGGASGSW